VGIDIEKQRDKILRIANKFTTEKEAEYIEISNDKVKILTAIWGVKESLYKLYGISGLSFKQHMDVAPFDIDSPYTKASVNYREKVAFFNADILTFNGFTCVYVTSN